MEYGYYVMKTQSLLISLFTLSSSLKEFLFWRFVKCDFSSPLSTPKIKCLSHQLCGQACR